jgi:hypothetical protein
VGQSRKAVNGRLRLTVYGRTRTVPVPYKMTSQRLTVRVRNRIYGPCLRNFTARLQALVVRDAAREPQSDVPAMLEHARGGKKVDSRYNYGRPGQGTAIVATDDA